MGRTGITLAWKMDKTKTIENMLSEWALRSLDGVAAEIQADAKAGTPVRTGALRASCYRISPFYNDYDSAVAEMESLNSAAVPVESLPYGEQDIIVGYAANYAPFVHDGTHLMAGQPFLLTAVERHQSTVEEIVTRDIEDNVRKAG